MKFFEPVFTIKQVQRERAKATRKQAGIDRPDAAMHAARLFMAHIPLNGKSDIALYSPVQTELETSALETALRNVPVKLCLPVVKKKNTPLIFRTYEPDMPLIKGRYNIPEPPDTAPIVTPDIILVPMLAFTSSGNRLGYGGGYYDRTIQALREVGDVLSVGYAFGAQEVDALEVEPLDQKMDWVVTERAALKTR